MPFHSLHFAPDHIKSPEEALVYYFSRMDVVAIEALLQDSPQLHELPLPQFISKLYQAFAQYREAGDTELQAHAGRCGECDSSCRGYSFMGNVSRCYTDIIIRSREGKPFDIYECCSFVADDETQGKDKGEHIRLDEWLQRPFK